MSQFDATRLAALLRAKRTQQGLGFRETALQVGTSPSTLSRIEGLKAGDMSLDTFIKVCDWLEIAPGDLISSANMARPDVGPVELIEIQLLGCEELGDVGRAVADLLRAVREKFQ